MKNASWKVLIFFTVIFMVLNLFSERERIVHYNRIGKVYGFPFSVCFNYQLNNGSEMVEGWYIENVIYNVVIYFIGIMVIMAVFKKKFAKNKGTGTLVQ